MYPTSSRFKTAVKESGLQRTVVDAFFDGTLTYSDLAVSGGTIRAELDGQIRRSGSIVIADPKLAPDVSSALAPLGAEVLVKQGIVYSDGTSELIPLGRFRVETSGWKDAEGVTTIQVYDRSKALQEVSLPDSFGRPGWLAQAVVVDFIEAFYPGLTYPGMFGAIPNYRIPGGHVFEESNYWDAAVALTKNMGARLHFDVTGTPRVAPVSDLSSAMTSDVDVFAGEGGILVEASREWSREGVCNGVQVTGGADPNGSIPSATVKNLAPGHPLRWGGPFGRVMGRINDSSITTTGQARIRAAAELSKYTGAAYSLDFTTVPNPAMDVGDIARVRFSSGEVQLHELSTLNIPLGPGQFTATSKGGYSNG